MITNNSYKMFDLAVQFINETSEHVFLTGKAGTGKTTFLKHIREYTHKRTLVAAPTGVAAVNAGGITLHSLFQLAFEPYIPGVYSKSAQKSRFRFSKPKLDLLKQLELLIIDEVSMLRSDTLDAIDNMLRGIRRNSKPFGGVQVLYIGDMFQLPPVVKEDEWELLKDHYESSFFFHAKVIRETEPVYLELTTVYRQTDGVFVELLNKIRNNILEPSDLDLLNSHYNPRFIPPEDEKYIILTTHNYKADQINNRKLQSIPSPSFSFSGEVKGEFPNHSLPTDMQLQLKEGAQIMFIKNDPQGDYYNGKIAGISRIVNDQIYVNIQDPDKEIVLKKELWTNMKYTLNKETGEIEEEELGSFSQYPIRLAWAITIHKSQGLTFDRAIIDAGASFAAGQTYVALSRCTSLEGVVLYSRILPDCIMTDNYALDFSKSEKTGKQLSHMLETGRRKFWAERLLLYFDWKPMFSILREFEKLLEDKTSEEFEPAKRLAEDFRVRIKEMESVSLKFKMQLARLIEEEQQTNDLSILKDRCQKAIVYFHENIVEHILKPLQSYISGFKATKKAKTFYKNITGLEEDILFFLENMKRVRYNNIPLADNMILEIPQRKDIFSSQGDNHIKEKRSSTEKKDPTAKPTVAKKEKSEKVITKKVSFDLYRQGHSIEEIATMRTLATSTIESHLAFFIRTGEISISDFLSDDDLSIILPVMEDFKEYENPPYKLFVQKLEGKYTFGQLRMAFNYLQQK